MWGKTQMHIVSEMCYRFPVRCSPTSSDSRLTQCGGWLVGYSALSAAEVKGIKQLLKEVSANLDDLDKITEAVDDRRREEMAKAEQEKLRLTRVNASLREFSPHVFSMLTTSGTLITSCSFIRNLFCDAATLAGRCCQQACHGVYFK